jgi:chorismate mutase
MDPMERLRRSIDEVDRRLVVLLNTRAGHAIALGRVKKARGMTIYQPSREEEVLRNVRGNNEGPLANGAVRRLFERIIDESRRIERIISAAEGASADGSRDGAETLDDASD